MSQKILIVDDDLETLRLVGVMLQRQGYEIAAANTGEMAVELSVSARPDLIILDVLMPTEDGYGVARQIRQNPATAAIPILMFSAKNQIEDKVSGYEAGADDYLTKPVHPLELTAHVKALLSKTSLPAADSEKHSGYCIGVIGAKGGLGVSTLALNLAIALAPLARKEVVAVEVRPGQGTWGLELDIADSCGLEKILSLPVTEISGQVIDHYAVRTTFGVRMLTAENKPSRLEFAGFSEKILALLAVLRGIIPITILDIGTPFLPGWQELCLQCNQLILLTDSYPATVLRTRRLLSSIQQLQSQTESYLDVVLYNHVRSDMQLSAEKVSQLLPGNPVRLMIPPVPELVYQANQKFTPVITIQSDSLFTQQMKELAKLVNSRIP